jgi:hypothetical protein
MKHTRKCWINGWMKCCGGMRTSKGYPSQVIGAPTVYTVQAQKECRCLHPRVTPTVGDGLRWYYNSPRLCEKRWENDRNWQPLLTGIRFYGLFLFVHIHGWKKKAILHHWRTSGFYKGQVIYSVAICLWPQSGFSSLSIWDGRRMGLVVGSG